jgi:hypothetical protein
LFCFLKIFQKLTIYGKCKTLIVVVDVVVSSFLLVFFVLLAFCSCYCWFFVVVVVELKCWLYIKVFERKLVNKWRTFWRGQDKIKKQSKNIFNQQWSRAREHFLGAVWHCFQLSNLFLRRKNLWVGNLFILSFICAYELTSSPVGDLSYTLYDADTKFCLYLLKSKTKSNKSLSEILGRLRTRAFRVVDKRCG